MRSLLARVARLVSALGPRGQIAIVDARPAGFGTWRLSGTLAEDICLNVSVFRDRAAAEAWLADHSLGTVNPMRSGEPVTRSISPTMFLQGIWSRRPDLNG